MKRSPINRQSPRKAAAQAQRRDLIRALEQAGLWECQIGVTLGRAIYSDWIDAHPWSERIVSAVNECLHEPSGLHEIRKRSSGGSLTLLANVLPACSFCNLWCEAEPDLAHLLGLVARPGDYNWFMLGADRGGF